MIDLTRQPELKVDQLVDTDGFGMQRILQAIGGGGMGIVYKTIRQMADGRFGQTYAAKTIRREFHQRPDILARFNREDQVIIGLDHENILGTHGLFWTTNTNPPIPLIFMEFLKGRTLREFMDTADHIPTWIICFVAHGVLSALQYIHDLGIIHRDIKPENIFLHDRGKSQRIRLMDFGIVRELRVAPDPAEHGHYVGTDGFSPPEQLQGRSEAITERSDLYALSAVLYEMFALRPVFPGLVAPEAIRSAHCKLAPTPLHILAPNAPRDLIEMVMRGLEKDPAKRPANARVYAEPFNHVFLASAQNASNATRENILHANLANSSFAAPRDDAPRLMKGPQLHTLRMQLVRAQPLWSPTTTAPSGPPEGALLESRPDTAPRAVSDKATVEPSQPLPVLVAPAVSSAAVEPARASELRGAEPRSEPVVGPLSSVAWGDASSAAGIAPSAESRRYVEESARDILPRRDERQSAAPEASVIVVDLHDARGQRPGEAESARGLPAIPPRRRVTSTTDPSTRSLRSQDHDPTDSPPEVRLAGPRPLYVGVGVSALVGLLIAALLVSFAEPRLPRLFHWQTAAQPAPPPTAIAAAPAASTTVAELPLVASPPATDIPSAMPSPAPTPIPPPVGAPPSVVAAAASTPTTPLQAASHPKSPAPRPRATAHPAAPASSVPDLDLFNVIRPESPAPPKPKSAPLPGAGF